MKAYPRSFMGWFWTVLGLVSATGFMLLPGMLALRMEWDVPDAWLPSHRVVWASAHGLAAFAALVLFGSLLPLHVRHGLRQARNRRTGILLLSVLPALLLTGWGIYYVIDEQWSRGISLLHVLLVVPLAAVVTAHALRARKIHSEFGSLHLR